MTVAWEVKVKLLHRLDDAGRASANCPAARGSAAFLLIASTLAGYTVFLAVNAQVSPTIANTFNYAPPVVAPLLLAFFLGEGLTLPRLLSARVALAGLALMLRASREEE